MAALLVFHLCLQAFHERGHAKHRNKSAMRRALREWVAPADNTDVPEMRAAAKRVRGHGGRMLDAWESGRANAVAEDNMTRTGHPAPARKARIG